MRGLASEYAPLTISGFNTEPDRVKERERERERERESLRVRAVDYLRLQHRA
jgi:hypothetical protein